MPLAVKLSQRFVMGLSKWDVIDHLEVMRQYLGSNSSFKDYIEQLKDEDADVRLILSRINGYLDCIVDCVHVDRTDEFVVVVQNLREMQYV